MIRLVARLAVAHCDARRDFVGHVGGDDFMLLLQSEDWQRRCEDIVGAFAGEARQLFDDQAREAGGIWAEDRHGIRRFFACTTLSIGVVRVAPGSLLAPEDIANLAALAKQQAKAQSLPGRGAIALHTPHDEARHPALYGAAAAWPA